jgi:hypothetical protein
LIGSSSGAESFGVISLFLLSPVGIMQSELLTEFLVGAIIVRMLYTDNKVFYTHGSGIDIENGNEPIIWLPGIRKII